jgi:hypothetical protein
VRRIAGPVLLALAGALACNDAFSPLDVATVTVTPAVDTLGAGQSVLFRATLQRANGDTIRTLPVTWSTSDTTVAVVDTTGRVTGRTPGQATVTAAIGFAHGQAEITVADSAPSITGISPAIGTVGTRLAIRGRRFQPGVRVLFDTLAADSTIRLADSLLTVVVPAGASTAGTAYSIKVHNPDGTSATALGFRASFPILQFVNGAVRPAGGPGSPVILEGQAFGDYQGSGQVLFSDGAGGTVAATIAGPADWRNTVIVTTVPPGAATGDLKVQTASGTGVAVTFTVTGTPPFDPSVLAWTGTSSLPVGLSGHAAVLVPLAGGGRVYVIGGADSSGVPRKNVLYSPVQNDGRLGEWTAATSLPTATAFATAVVATPSNSRLKIGAGVIYLLGGVVDGAPVATVFRGLLNPDGTITSWSGGALPEALHSASAAIVRGDLYIAGGSGSGNVPVATVYRARIDSLGVLGAWHAEPPLPFPRSYAAVGQAGNTLYVFGGDSAAVSPDDPNLANGTKVSQIVYASPDLRTGDLAGWTVNGGALGKAIAKHTAVLLGGRVLLTGGLYVGADAAASEESYATVNQDGSVGAFADATGTHTIVSAGGRSLFNHAAVAYLDASGTPHVLIVGGDDVNAPGKKRAEVWLY